MGKLRTAPADFLPHEGRGGCQKFLPRACTHAADLCDLGLDAILSGRNLTIEKRESNSAGSLGLPGNTACRASLGNQRDECRFFAPVFADASIGTAGNTKVQGHDDRACVAARVSSRCPP